MRRIAVAYQVPLTGEPVVEEIDDSDIHSCPLVYADVIEISADHCFISPTGKHDFRNRNSCHHCDMPAAWVNGRECGS